MTTKYKLRIPDLISIFLDIFFFNILLFKTEKRGSKASFFYHIFYASEGLLNSVIGQRGVVVTAKPSC